jgi:F-type H+-transporting ATPase subunit epsilon
MSTFLLRIITPEKEFFKEEVDCVTIHTLEGSRGILKRHEAFISYLPIGKIKIRNSDEVKIAAITGGIIHVSKKQNEVKIVTNACEWETGIDIDRAMQAKDKAVEVLATKPNIAETKVYEYRLECAKNRIKIIENLKASN